MNFSLSQRISTLGGYAFAEVDKKVEELRQKGIEPIDFGVGDPIDPTPEFIREALKNAADMRSKSGYPSTSGTEEFRSEISAWYERRFSVSLDPSTEITSTIGSKEAVFHFPLAFVDAGDVVISPTPGYPPYQRGTTFAGGENFLLPLRPDNDFLPDFSEIPDDVARRAKILWLCFPSNPTGKCAPDAFWQEAIAWAKKWNVIIASDECYTELYFDENKKPRSVLEFTREGVVAFGSLSKRSNMTTYRVGWLAGDPAIIAAFRKVKGNIDSGTPTFVQDAAVVALRDESHVQEMREKYRARKEILFESFREMGMTVREPEATFYLWQRAPHGMTGVEFALRLLEPDAGIVVTPGTWISDTVRGYNPGEDFVRFALVPDFETTKKAGEILKMALRRR